MYASASEVSVGDVRGCAAYECCESEGAVDPCPCALEDVVQSGDASRMSSTRLALGPFPDAGDPGSGGSSSGMRIADDERDDCSGDDSVAFAERDVDRRRSCPDSLFTSSPSGLGRTSCATTATAAPIPSPMSAATPVAAADPRRLIRGVEGN